MEKHSFYDKLKQILAYLNLEIRPLAVSIPGDPSLGCLYYLEIRPAAVFSPYPPRPLL